MTMRALGRRAAVGLLRWMALLAMGLALAGCDKSMSPLHEAVIRNDTAAVRAWIAERGDLNVTYDEKSRGVEGNYARRLGITPLMVAAAMGQLDIVKLLVEAGANAHAQSNTQLPGEPRTAFDAAVEAGQLATARYLWEHGDPARLGTRLERHITQSCPAWCKSGAGQAADSNLFLFLVGIASEAQRDAGIGHALCFTDPQSPLARFVAAHVKPFPKGAMHCAAFDLTARTTRSQAQREALVSWMLDQGADLNQPSTGYSVLMGAASAHDQAMVRFLLSKGADPNRPDTHGRTAIGIAANTCVLGGPTPEVEQRMQPQVQVIEELLRAGADTRSYTPDMIRSKVPLLAQCCSRQPQPRAQQRICQVFGL